MHPPSDHQQSLGSHNPTPDISILAHMSGFKTAGESAVLPTSTHDGSVSLVISLAPSPLERPTDCPTKTCKSALK
jgi:hypothetical protein